MTACFILDLDIINGCSVKIEMVGRLLDVLEIVRGFEYQTIYAFGKVYEGLMERSTAIDFKQGQCHCSLGVCPLDLQVGPQEIAEPQATWPIHH